jgi:hypothetical protein
MKPPSSLALAASRQSQLAIAPSRFAQANLEPRHSAPRGGRPPMDRQSWIHGGKLGRGTSLHGSRVALGAMNN